MLRKNYNNKLLNIKIKIKNVNLKINAHLKSEKNLSV